MTKNLKRENIIGKKFTFWASNIWTIKSYNSDKGFYVIQKPKYGKNQKSKKVYIDEKVIFDMIKARALKETR